jgi:YfiH family protein
MPYLTCRLLKNWQHGFFTQQFWRHSPAELVNVLHPPAAVYQVKQVHGNTVLKPSEIEVRANEKGEKTFSEADGMITEKSRQSVWVASADCTPVLIADAHTSKVAAIHAGWRGTAKRIVPEAIARFLAMGSSLENLIFALGPAINGEVYQVSEEVATEVGTSLIPASNVEGNLKLLKILREIPQTPILDDPAPGKVKLDVRRIISLQLEKLGVAQEKVAIAPYCTYQQPEYFFSYRRTKEKKVQWSGIMSN